MRPRIDLGSFAFSLLSERFPLAGYYRLKANIHKTVTELARLMKKEEDRIRQGPERLVALFLLAPTLFLLAVPLLCIPNVKASQIRLEDISGEASFFWEQNATSHRWMPELLVFLNNTSGTVLHIDMVNVTFREIAYSDGRKEEGFHLGTGTWQELPIGGFQYLVVLSEYGFDGKPSTLNFEFRLHILEAGGSLVFSPDNHTVPLSSMRQTLQKIELRYDILDDGRASVTYTMVYRNPGINPITVEIALRYLETDHPVDETVPVTVDDPTAGNVTTRAVGQGTLMLLAPYLKVIPGGSSYVVSLKFTVKEVVSMSDDVHVVRELSLIQPPYVQSAVLRVRIPNDQGIFESLSNVDWSCPPDGPASLEMAAGRAWNSWSWTSPNAVASESFLVISVSRISYLYSFDPKKAGLSTDSILPMLYGAALTLILGKAWGAAKKKRKTRYDRRGNPPSVTKGCCRTL